jgi:asparagine synthase (glutamine-hydrolysing)
MDARIDNAEQLVSILGLDSHDQETIGDAQLISAAYERWGEQAPEHLVGDFAFAIWDAARRRFFCARDPMGIKPLCYYYSNKLFVFASEIKAILASPEVPRLLNERKIADHLRWNFDDAQSTFYQDVVRLPAGHSLTVSTRSIQLRRYWSPNCSRELRLKSDEEYAEAFREIFVESVRCRTRSAFPIGSTLSGGLDSSSIVCTANGLLADSQRPLRTFSAVFPSLPESELRRIDERPYVESVLKRGRFDHCFVRADRASPLCEWRRMFSHLDEACWAPNLYLHWELYKAASGRGVRVLLDGLDGDTTVSHGLDYLSDLVRAGRWVRFVKESTALSRRNPRAYPIRSVLWEFGVRPLVPGRVVGGWRALRSQLDRACDPPDIVGQQLERRIQRGNGDATHQHNRSRTLDSTRENHWRALCSPLMSSVLELTDAASSAFAIEARYPFFDQRLIEFCIAIPPEQKLRDGWTRAVMRRAMEGILPEEVQWRVDKANLGFNFRRRLFEHDRAIVEQVVESRLASLEGYVDVQAVRNAYQRWSQQKGMGQRDAQALYRVVVLGLWLETSGLTPSTTSHVPADRDYVTH